LTDGSLIRHGLTFGTDGIYQTKLRRGIVYQDLHLLCVGLSFTRKTKCIVINDKLHGVIVGDICPIPVPELCTHGMWMIKEAHSRTDWDSGVNILRVWK
jgi:hypothetical protein